MKSTARTPEIKILPIENKHIGEQNPIQTLFIDKSEIEPELYNNNRGKTIKQHFVLKMYKEVYTLNYYINTGSYVHVRIDSTGLIDFIEIIGKATHNDWKKSFT